MPYHRYLTIPLLLIMFLTGCADEYIAIEKSDMSPLYVISTIPANGSVNVERNLSPEGGVIINFSKTLDEKYITEDYFDFTCNGVKPDSKVSPSEDRKTVIIKLKQGITLPEQAFCRLVISKQIKDKAGLPFYLSENSTSASLLNNTDAGTTDTSKEQTNSFKDRRTGEGDYILEFVTRYEPLKILSIIPEDKSVIPLNLLSETKGVAISFNKPLAQESINSSNFIIQGEETELQLSEDKKIVTIIIKRGLQEGKTYYPIIMPFVKDEAGIMLDKTYNFSFSTELVRPKVEVIDPPDGTLTVNYNLKTISVEFNKEIDSTTINNYTVALTNVDNYSVRYQDKTAYIENFRLMEKTDYTVFVSSQIRDTSGFTLEKSYQSRFRTTYDTPYIKTVFPSNNATNVPPSLPNIDIEFSEDMNFENLNESLFIIEPAVPFSLKVTDSKSVQLKILSPLLSGNTYTVRVKDAITDISGIRMDKPFESSFKVAATPDNNLPSDIVIYSKYISEPVTDRRKGFILEWKAPSADIINSKPTGKIRGYSLVYSEEPFDYKDFNKMTEIAGVPTPANPGDIQNMILYSLIDKENNEKPLVYNKTYYFMLRATDGTNFVYSNLLATGIIAEKNKIFLGDKFSGVSMKYIRNFNKENVFAIGNTGDSENGKTLGSVSIMKIVNGNINELFRIYGKSENSLFGYKIESADINNDGCPDLIVSAPLNGQEREGAIFIYTQTKNGSDCIFTPSEPVRISGGTKESMFGFSLNKFLMNGKENLIVGAPNSKGLNTGEVFIYFNRTNILQIPQRGDVVITGKNSGSSFGYASVASDFNGDSCPDLIISAPDELSGKRGSVFILYTATSVNGCVIQNTDIENANLRIDGVADYTRLGYNLFTADINGDNINELILSGRDEAANSGVIFIREPNKTNILKITGEYGGNFGFHIEAANDCRMNGCDGGINAKCKDIFISDEKLSRIYLLEGKEDISQYTINNLVKFADNSNPVSFGYSFVIFSDNQIENLFISSPFVRNFNDYISEFYIYR